jgi:hypothetical protein
MEIPTLTDRRIVHPILIIYGIFLYPAGDYDPDPGQEHEMSSTFTRIGNQSSEPVIFSPVIMNPTNNIYQC